MGLVVPSADPFKGRDLDYSKHVQRGIICIPEGANIQTLTALRCQPRTTTLILPIL